MSDIPKISEAEWQVIKVLWNKAPLTANQVISKLEKTVDWNQHTIRTLINRLVKKNALSYEVKGKAYYYYPLVSEEACMKEETKSFIKKIYNGSFNPLIKNFVKEVKMTPEEINELRSILNEKENKK